MPCVASGLGPRFGADLLDSFFSFFYLKYTSIYNIRCVLHTYSSLSFHQASSLASTFGADWLRLDFFYGHPTRGWQISEVSYPSHHDYPQVYIYLYVYMYIYSKFHSLIIYIHIIYIYIL